MKIAIMQPYIFPYLGYFQLIKAVDLFGIGDDVQFIKGGWINRNNIVNKDKIFTFTFPVKKDNYQKIISERFYNGSFVEEKEKFYRILKMFYGKAPFYKQTMEVLDEVFEFKDFNVANFNRNQLKRICKYLNIDTPFINSSEWKIENSDNLNTEERAIKKLDKVRNLGITHFVNAIGGQEIYKKDFFKKNGLELNFIKTLEISYKQFGTEFIPRLSIIDIMMFNPPEKIDEYLKSYELI